MPALAVPTRPEEAGRRLSLLEEKRERAPRALARGRLAEREQRQRRCEAAAPAALPLDGAGTRAQREHARLGHEAGVHARLVGGERRREGALGRPRRRPREILAREGERLEEPLDFGAVEDVDPQAQRERLARPERRAAILRRQAHVARGVDDVLAHAGRADDEPRARAVLVLLERERRQPHACGRLDEHQHAQLRCGGVHADGRRREVGRQHLQARRPRVHVEPRDVGDDRRHVRPDVGGLGEARRVRQVPRLEAVPRVSHARQEHIVAA